MTLRTRQVHGFTLLELLVVLVIASMLVTLATPMYSAAVPGARLRAEVLDLSVSLRDSRNRAITIGRTIRIQFHADSSTYTFADSKAVRLPQGIELVAGTYASDRYPARGKIASNYELKFYPDGSSDGASIDMRNESARYRIDVDWLTGRVKVSEVSHGQH